MIKKVTLALTLALTASLASAATTATAADHPVREIWGKGKEACPKQAVCLYQDSDYNNDSHDGRGRRIWVITGSTTTIPGGDNEASSVYANIDFPYSSVELYEHHDFGGRYVTNTGGSERGTLKGVHVTPSGDGWAVNFNDTISSVKFTRYDEGF
ncbi:peptidase inhibitor family I36 protein [Streptomyces niveus]|uniref:peptidase inhibitor family I36 protein n=1 Tax=Streptomyces niveus TaxID=193462 RepID=UPI00364774E1